MQRMICLKYDKTNSVAYVKTMFDNGVLSWFICDSCKASVKRGDKYCSKCRKILVWENKFIYMVTQKTGCDQNV